MIEVAIVEDELEEQQRLLHNLKRYAQENQQPFHFSLYASALDFLDERKDFDIVFMDIMMPNCTGMEAAMELRKRGSRSVLIFVTTMLQFAIKSYEVDALDYIVKPVTYERLTMKLHKALKVIQSSSGGTIIINDTNGIVKQPTNDILYIEVHGHKLAYHTVSQVYTAYGSLGELEKVLQAYHFMRCNACFLVNPQHIIQVNNKELIAVLSNGEELKISQSRRKSFISELTNWLGQGKC